MLGQGYVRDYSVFLFIYCLCGVFVGKLILWITDTKYARIHVFRFIFWGNVAAMNRISSHYNYECPKRIYEVYGTVSWTVMQYRSCRSRVGLGEDVAARSSATGLIQEHAKNYLWLCELFTCIIPKFRYLLNGIWVYYNHIRRTRLR